MIPLRASFGTFLLSQLLAVGMGAGKTGGLERLGQNGSAQSRTLVRRRLP